MPDNIILLMADQLKASALPLYGHPVTKAETWKRIAAEGVTFERCFAASPVCAPSRASIMTGLSVPVHGVSCNRLKVETDTPQLPELLRGAGYTTGVVGHYDADAGLDKGWNYSVDWWDRKYNLCQVFFSAYELSKAKKPLKACVSGVLPYPPDDALAARMTRYATQFLDEAKEPFFLHLAHLEPHPPYFTPEPYASMYDPVSLPYPPMPGENQPAWQKEAAEEMNLPECSENEKRLVISRYLGAVSYLDHWIGELATEIERRGMSDRTWIILASDHGDFTGEHGLFAKAHAGYDCLLHVPLVIRPPGGIAPKRVEELVELTDLFSTILDMAGCPPPEYVESRSLLPVMEGGAGRDSVFASVGAHPNPRPSFPQGMPLRGIHKKLLKVVRTDKTKYIRDPENGDEWYDLEADPFELEPMPGNPPPDMVGLMERREEDCRRLREKLGLNPAFPGE